MSDLVDSQVSAENGSRSNGASSSSDEDEATTKTVSHRLSREEREDLVHSLEHIVTVGSHLRHKVQRINNEWTKEDNNTTCRDPRLLHAEDVRIYGNPNGSRMAHWPAKRKSSVPNDKEWDHEHGDMIHPLAFCEARLSDDVPRTKRQRIDGPNLSVETTDCTVAQAEVPRAMLLQCWERAVHAAASVIPVENESAQPKETEALGDEQYSRESAVKKCQELNIHLDSNSCPTCEIEFDTQDALQKHFFGVTGRQRGCCWTTIRRRQYELLDRVLQKEVTECAHGLIGMVLSSSLDDDNRETNAGRAGDWRDVMRILESNLSQVAAPREGNSSTDATTETLLYNPSMLPMPLNPHILQSVSMRLAERYANLPW